MATISIIVPVFNVAPYLPRCLDSLCAQTLADLEILCVDDGSTDASAAILANYASADRRIRVLSRPNGGLSAARNTGLDAATAPFVMFCDSDDWVEPTWCEELHAELLRSGADFVTARAFIEGRTSPRRRRDLAASHRLTRTGVVSITPDLRRAVNPAVWVKIFRRDFLTRYNLRFAEGLIYEDALFTMACLSVATTLSFLDRRLYHYFQREGSILAHDVRLTHHALDRVRLAVLARAFLMRNGRWEVWRGQWFEILRAATDNSLADAGCVLSAVYDLVPPDVQTDVTDDVAPRTARWMRLFAKRKLIVPLRIRRGIGPLTLLKVVRTQFKTTVRVLGLPIFIARRKDV